MVETKFNEYEIMYIVDDQNFDKVESLKKEFIEILTKDNGKITEAKDFVQQFAYKINHRSKGHYFVLKLTTTSKNIADFSRIFLIKQKQGEVVRKLIINLDSEKINTFKELPKREERYKEHSRETRDKDKELKNHSSRPEVKKVIDETKIKKEKEEKASETPKVKSEEK